VTPIFTLRSPQTRLAAATLESELEEAHFSSTTAGLAIFKSSSRTSWQRAQQAARAGSGRVGATARGCWLAGLQECPSHCTASALVLEAATQTVLASMERH